VTPQGPERFGKRRVAILAELPYQVVPQSQLPDVVEDVPVGLHGV
jgi:hypothetical protein